MVLVLLISLFVFISSVAAGEFNSTNDSNSIDLDNDIDVKNNGGNVKNYSKSKSDLLSSNYTQSNNQKLSDSNQDFVGAATSSTLTITASSASSFSFSFSGRTANSYYYNDGPSGTVVISCDGYSRTFSLSCSRTASTSSSDGYAQGTASGSVTGSFVGKCTVTASMTITCHSTRDWSTTQDYTHTSTASFDLTKISTSLSAITVSSTSYEYAAANHLTLSGTLNSYNSKYSAAVVIKRGSTQLATVDVGSGGSWSYTVSSTAVNPGSYTYTVSFSGNDKYSSAESKTSSSITVNQGTPQLTFSQSDVVNVCPGEVKITVTAKNALNSALSGLTITPSGTNIGTSSAVTNSNGQVSFVVSNLSASTYSWSFTTTANTLYKSVSNSNSFTVNKISPTLSDISLNTNSYVYLGSQNLVLSGTLNGINSQYAPGSVTILRGGNVIATADLNSSGEWSYTVLSNEVIPGIYTYAVSYDGNDYYNQATSKSANVNVLRSPIDLGSASTTNYRFNNGTSNVVYSGQFIGVDGISLANATGAIIYCDGNRLGTAIVGSDGSWEYSTGSTSLMPNDYILTVAYGGNEYYDAANAGNPQTLSVYKMIPNLGSAIAYDYRYAISNSVLIYLGMFTPIDTFTMNNNTGAIIYCDGNKLGTASVGSDGSWSYSNSATAISCGNHTLTVAYGGNEYYESITTPGNDKTMSVFKNNITIGDAITHNYYYGSSTSGVVIYSGQFADKFNDVSMAKIGGAIIYCDGLEIGSADVDEDGVWAFATPLNIINPGNHTLTVAYAGNDYYNSLSRGNARNISVYKNTPNKGNANSFDYGYGNSSHVVIFSGQFGGKVNDVSLANSTGAIIYRDGVEVSRVAVDDDGRWEYSIVSSSLEIDTYKFTVAYGGNLYYNGISVENENNVSVLKGTPVITTTVTITSKSYKGVVSILVTVTNGEGTPLNEMILTPSGTCFNLPSQITDANGQSTFTVSGLNASTYSDWMFTTTANEHYESTNSSYVSFTIEKQVPTITSVITNVAFIDPGNQVIIITVLDKEGRPLENFNVTSNGTGISHQTKTTNSSGSVLFNFTNIAYGIYTDWTFTTGEYDNYASATHTLPKITIVPNDSFTALNFTIANLKGNVLNLTHNYQYYNDYDSGFINNEITLNKYIVINGNGYTIDAKNKLRIFKITANNVVINNLTFTGGYSTGNGGALYVTGNYVTLSHTTFKNNKVSNSHGGAIYWDGSHGNITYSNFESNSAKYDGAIYWISANSVISHSKFTSNTATEYCGALDSNSPNSTLINVTFTSNSAKKDGAAGLGSTGHIEFWGCTFNQNKATSGLGGAITANSEVTIKIVDCVFTSNTATSDGGAVYMASKNGIILNSTFNSNSASRGGSVYISGQNAFVNNSKFISNQVKTGDAMGGAIYCVGNYATILNSDFRGNIGGRSNDWGNGGAIYVICNNVEIKYCNFTNNKVTQHDGGAIYFRVGYKNILVSDCRFDNNYAEWVGSAIACFSSNATFKNNVFINNYNNKKQDGSKNFYGGALAFRDVGGQKVINCTFIRNAQYGGGGIRIHSSSPNVEITDCVFINNTASTYGGGVYTDASGTKIKNCVFSGNTAVSNHGGGVYSYGGSCSVSTSLFVSNTAASGGAFYAYSTGHVIRDSIFLGNTAKSTGYIISSADGSNRVDANYNWFGNVVGNKTVKPKVYNSGVILTRWYFLDIDVNEQFLFTNGTSNVTFSLNRYYDSSVDNVIKGNFKYPDIVKLNITSRDDMLGFNNITLDENKEYPTQTVYIPEIGVYTITAKYMGVTATNSIYYVPPDSFTALNRTISLNYNDNLILNHSYRYYDEYDFLFLGTGIKINKPINIDGNGTTIDAKNKVRIFYVGSDNVTLTNLNFVNGHADNGGAIYWNGKNGILNNSNLRDHSATSQAGAIYWNGEYGLMNLCNITNNHADGLAWTGGAIFWAGQYGLINNTNFKNNSAIKYGSSDAGDCGALSIAGNYLVVDYCNFTENQCANGGGAIGTNGCQYINITNSIFTNNGAIKSSSSSAQGAGGALYLNSADFLVYNCSFINNFASNNGGAIRTSARGNVLSSIFFNNTSPTGPVLYASASGVVISDCIILNNKATSTGYIVSSDASGRITANGNWWGNTLNNQKTRPGAYSGVSVTNWYFLNIETSAKYLFTGETCNVTYRLDQITTSGGVVTQRKLNNILPVLFNFTATIGELDIYSAILDENRIVNNTFVSYDVGICTLTVTALGVTASTKVYYVPPDSFMALNMTIERNYGTNLNLTHGYQYYQDYDFELLNTGVIINKPINITGNGYTLNAKSKLRVFKLSADNVHLDGLNYINGYSTDNGGIVYVTGKNVVLSNSNFTGGSANRYSGAVHIDARNVSIINSIFNNNKVRVTGKNYYGGGAIAVSSSSDGSSIIGCRFLNNYAYMSGGAILWDGPNGRIEDTYFEANNAKTFDGGAVHIRSSGSNMVINNITAYKNHDGGYGSVISAFAPNILINNSRFIGNDYNNARSYGGTIHFAAANAKIYNSYFENNRAYNGGAITTLSANNIIQNVTFINNKAVKLGGAINVQGSPSNVKVTDCTFRGNYAGNVGGAIRVTSTNAQGFRLTNSTFKDNHAYNYGGAVSIQTANAIINNTYYDNNYVNKHDGGALDLNGANIIVDNSTFNNNRGVYGGGIAWYKSNGKLINSVFTNNYATGHDGGGLCVFSGATNMFVCNVTMISNTAKYAGAAIQSDGSGTCVYNSTFTKNKGLSKSYGGTICFYRPNGKVIGCNFTSNSVRQGGGIYTLTNSHNTYVESCRFIDNYASSSGGAIHISKNTRVTVNNCYFRGNSAPGDGGAIVIYGSSYGISNSTFENNHAKNGGAIGLHATSTITIDHNNFIGDYATNRGGAIDVPTRVNILYCNFTNTHAPNYGGAVYLAASNSVIQNSFFNGTYSSLGGAVYIATVAQVSNSIFNLTKATTHGGAIYINAKNSVVSSSEFNNAAATKAGGAIYISATSTVKNSNFNNNTAGTYGGAIYVSPADVKLIGDKFNFNNATIDGGAVYIVGKNALINQSVFNHNNAVIGPAIYWEGANGVLYDSVVDNHTSKSTGTVYVKGNDVNIILTNMSYNTAKNGGALYIVGNNANMSELNLINNTGDYGGALYVGGRNPTITSTNFTNNRGRYGAGMFIANDVTLNPSNFTNNVASKLGGAGYAFEFIDHVGTTLTYENWTTQTDNFYSAYVKLLNDTIYVGQTVMLRMVNETYTGNVTLEIANRSYNTTWINVTHRLADVSDLPWGVYTDIHAVYHAQGSLHNEEFALVDLTIKRYPTETSLIDNSTYVGGQVRIRLNETLAEGNITLAFENGLEYEVEVRNGIAYVILDHRVVGGDYNVTLLYSGDDIYDISKGYGKLHVDKLNVTPTLAVNWTYVDDEIIIIMPDDATGELNVTINGYTYTADVFGNVTIPLDKIIPGGIYPSINIKYSGDEIYNSAQNRASLQIFDYPVDIVLVDNVTQVNTTLLFFLYHGGEEGAADITGNISFVINGKTFKAEVIKEVDVDGDIMYIGEIDISGLPGGLYKNITLHYASGSTYYRSSDINITFLLDKLDADLTYVGPEILDLDRLMNFTLYENVSGYISFTYEGHVYNATIHDIVNATEAIINATGLKKGIYELIVSYWGDDYFNAENITVRFIVKDLPEIKLNNTGDVYESVELNVNITGNVTGTAFVYVDGLKHARINVTQFGDIYTLFDVSLNNVTAGFHNITVEYLGDELHFNNTVVLGLFIHRANSFINITNVVNATYNTTSVLVNFTVTNRTSVYINVTNDKGETVYYNYTSENHIMFSDLVAGTYLITFNNVQSLNYNATSNFTYFTVYRANTLVNITEIINGTYNTTNATVRFDVTNRTIITVIVYKNGTDVVVYNNTNFTGTAFTIGNLSAGIYNITILNNESSNYNQFIISELFEIYRAPSEVVINNITNGYYNTTNATVVFDVTNRTGVTILVYKNGTNILVYNNTNFIGNNFTIGNLSAGIYNITIINHEGENYTAFNATALFTVYKVSSFVNITGVVNATYNTTNVTVDFSITNRTNVTIIVTRYGNSTVLVNLTNFEGNIFTIGSLGAGIYNITIVNNENENYTMHNATALFEVYKSSSFVNITEVINGTYNTSNVSVKYEVVNITSIKVIIFRNGTDEIVYNDTIDGNFTIGTLGAGVYNITIINAENVNFTRSSASALFTVHKSASFTNITQIINGTYNTTGEIIDFLITNRTNVTVVIAKNGTSEVITINNVGGNRFTMGNLTSGLYNITLINNEDENFTMSNSSRLFTIMKASSFVNITEVINGTYNTTDVVVKFNITNSTVVSIVVKNQNGDVVYENMNFTLSQFTIGNLTAGNYNITIYNAENDNYNASNMTGSFTVVKATSEVVINNVTAGIFNTTNAIVDFTVTNRTIVSILVFRNGTTECVFNSTDFAGSKFAIGNLTPGIYNITIYNNESDNYNASQTTGLFEVLKAPSFVNITEIINGIYNTTNATVKFDVVNQTIVQVTVLRNGTIEYVFNSTDFKDAIFTISNLTTGVYNITISNIENGNYTGYATSALFIVYKASSLVNITEIIPGVYNTTNATVNFNITNRTDVKVVVIKNGTDIIVYDNNNFTDYRFTIGNLTAGVYNITITNLGDDNYESSSDSILFTVYGANSNVEILNVVNATFNTTNVEVSFNITNRTTVSIVIRNATGDVVYTANDFQGDLFSIGTLNAGNYNITITNNVGDNYNASSDSALFTIYKANSSLIITEALNSTYKVNNTIISLDVINLTSISYIIYDMNGQIVVEGNASSIPVVLEDLNVGIYNITVINVENNNFLSSNDSAIFSIIKSYSEVHITDIVNGTLGTDNVIVKFNVIRPTTVSIIVRDSNGNIVYNNSDFKGNTFSIGSLSTGVYNITIINAETDNVYTSNNSGLFKVVVPTTIPSSDISRGYKSPYDYVAVFTDEFGNKLNNTNVSMMVNGEIYNVTTDENGVAYLNVTLPVGTHEIKLFNPVSGENQTRTTTIVERLQENKDIVMDFCDGTYYSVRAYGDDAKPIQGVYVAITINGVSYDVKTNKDGYALLKIRLNPNKFKITAEWKDYKINKIIVKQTLKAKSATAKKSAKYFKYSATLKWSNGKAIVGKKIVFKFRGKKYVAKTNKKGVATIKIKKSALKKLKVGKKYYISITYNNIDNGYISVNNIAKLIKIKK